MASNGTTDEPTGDEERPESLSFTLQVVSPSVGVSTPLVFPQLPATTSVKELKAKIRAILSSQPSDENQRLIHRGRLLGNEAETMATIFGRDTLQTPQSQTLHLVLRPTHTDNPPIQPGTPLPVPQNHGVPPTGLPPLPLLARTNHPAPRVQPIPTHQQFPTTQQYITHVEQRNHILMRQLAQLQQETERLHHAVGSMEQRAQALATAAGIRPTAPTSIHDLIAQQQRERAAEGRLGVQDNNIARSGRSSPTGSENLTNMPRNVIGPNGEHLIINGAGADLPAFRPNPNATIGDRLAMVEDAQALRQPHVEALLAMMRDHTNPEAARASARALHERHMGTNMVPINQQNVPATSFHQSQHFPYENLAPQNGGLPTTENSAHQTQDSNGQSTNEVRVQNVVTTYREHIDENGERTVVQHQIVNGHPVQPGHVLANGARYTHNPIPDLMAHMQAHARAARSPHRVPGTGTGPMERSASNPTIGNPSAVRAIPTAATGTNTPVGHQHFNRTQPNFGNPASLRNSSGEPTVYMLSSPSGPRALLVTNQETFYSRSAQPTQRSHYNAVPGNDHQLPEYRNRPARGARRAHRQERANGNDNANANAPIAAPHANPEAGALAARLVPMLWLVIRLVGFVWFFTSHNASWSKWLLICSLAFAVFIFNTGVLNGIVNDLWAPVRAHLEALIPLAGPDAALIPAVNAAPIPQVGQAPTNEAVRRGELDPQQYAARIIEQRRQQNGWFMTHVRRVEHSFLLFVASLIPGVGERHIAAREAEAIERQRQIDAAAAAAAEAEAAANAETENVGEGEGTQEGQGANEQAVQEEQVPHVAPLIDV